MGLVAVDEKLDALIRELEFKDVKDLIKDSLISEIFFRISGFKEEKEHFERRYGKTLAEFKKEYEAGEEDFIKYEDIMEWEFAEQGKEYWEKKLEELKNVFALR